MKVAILAVDHGALFELGCAVELFGLSRPEYSDWYDCEVITFDQPELPYTAGIRIAAKRVRSLDNFDMLVIPSWDTENTAPGKRLKDEVTRFHRAGKRIISFCSGSFLLGYLGLLNGREATTHWRYGELFRERFPDTHCIDNVLFVYDGVIGCSAGSAAGLDLGIEVIREDFGYRIANQVARRLVLSAHRNGGQSQFVETPVLRSPGKFTQTLEWCIANISEVRNVATMADRARMSRRSFDRKFRATTGIAPNEWLVDQRLNIAKSLLEDSADSIDTIATCAGFGSTVTMRHHFRQKYGISPSQYRDQFRRRAG